MQTPPLITIVSGGQTGADRAGLDFALANGLPHEGWCPQGRKARDGPLPAHYLLQETPSGGYLQRTEWNVRDSDGTVVCTLADPPVGGSAKTIEFCQLHGKPCLHLHPGLETPEQRLAEFVRRQRIQRLNVAGSSEEREPGLAAWTLLLLEGRRALLEPEVSA
jgi:hypothetical protein